MESEDFNIDKENAKLYGYGQIENEEDDFDPAAENAKLYGYYDGPEKEKSGAVETEGGK